MGIAQMRDAGHAKAEHVTVAHHAADRPASEIDAMIALLAADDPQALALAAAAMVLDRHLDRALDGFRPRADEKDAVDALGHQLGDLASQLETARGAELEGGRVNKHLE